MSELKARESLSDYLRRVYIVEDPSNEGYVVARKQYDGSVAGVWREGGFVPHHLYYRYLDVVPGAREDFVDSFKVVTHYELPQN